jgi:hypothetical protein
VTKFVDFNNIILLPMNTGFATNIALKFGGKGGSFFFSDFSIENECGVYPGTSISWKIRLQVLQ